MNLSKIVSISGRAGLYRVIAQSKNTLIIESLIDKKRVSTQPTERVSELENIGFYTYNDDVPLKDIYKKIAKKENCGLSLSHKESLNTLTAYLRDILPDYDEERVYNSDIKKLFQWYNILQQADLIVLEEEKEGAAETDNKSESDNTTNVILPENDNSDTENNQ